MSDLQTVQNELSSASTALDDLRSALRDGSDVDLDAFNLMVAETCSAAVSLPKIDAIKVRQQLEQLLNSLTEARDEIAAEQERLAEEIAAASDSRTADGPPSPAKESSDEETAQD